jgi:cysteinyl-tRNA synthetase
LQHLKEPASGGVIEGVLTHAENEFAKGLSDDLNISHSLASLFDLVREVNALMDQKKLSTEEAKLVLKMLEKFNTVLDVLDFKASSLEIVPEVQQLFDRRMQARNS